MHAEDVGTDGDALRVSGAEILVDPDPHRVRQQTGIGTDE
jgi:hypothetical protein